MRSGNHPYIKLIIMFVSKTDKYSKASLIIIIEQVPFFSWELSQQPVSSRSSNLASELSYICYLLSSFGCPRYALIYLPLCFMHKSSSPYESYTFPQHSFSMQFFTFLLNASQLLFPDSKASSKLNIMLSNSKFHLNTVGLLNQSHVFLNF